MSTHRASEVSLRLDRLETNRLIWAFAISLAVHLIVWGGYEGGKKLGIWSHLRVPAWLQRLNQALAPKPARKVEMTQTEPPLMFVDVRDSQAVTEPPKNPVGYSDKSSVAANPENEKDTSIPKLTGDQQQVVRTIDADRKPFDKLMPAPAPVKPDETPEEQRPRPKPAPGDLTVGKPEKNPQDTGDAEKPKPKTLTEARFRKQETSLPGRLMKQDGGVRRRAANPSLDVKATGFGAYDRAFIDAVQQKWYDQLDARNYEGYQEGRVVIEFKLHYDGTITDVVIKDTTVGSVMSHICRKAIMDPAPYERWPREMRLMIGEDYRKITFTFFYN